MSDFFSNMGFNPREISGGFNFLGGLAGGAFGGNPQTPNAPTFDSNMNNPYFYQPTWQGGADTQAQGYFGDMGQFRNFGQYQGANQFNPYGSVQPGLAQYYQGMQNNPYAQYYQNAGNYAGSLSQMGSGQAGQGGSESYGVGNFGQHGVLQALQGLGNNNPYLNQMIQGAQYGGGQLEQVGRDAILSGQGLGGIASGYAAPLTQFATQGAGGLQGLAQSTTQGLMPYAESQASQLPGLASSYAQPGNAAAMSVLNTSFDPQGQLYGREFQQNQDQTRASLAARGIDTSGTGAGIEMQSNRDFNTNWLDRQLGRQQQGLSAYESAANTNYGMQSQAGSQGLSGLLEASSGTFNPYSTAYGQGVSGLGTAAKTGYDVQSDAASRGYELGAAGANSIISGSAAPYNQQNQALNNYYGQMGSLANTGHTFGGIQGLGGNQYTLGIQNEVGAGQLPYQTRTGTLGDQYLGANNYLNAGTQGTNINRTNAGVNAGLSTTNDQQINSLLNYLMQGTNAATQFAGAQNTNFGNQVSLFEALLKQQQQKSGGIGSLFGGLGDFFGGSGGLSSMMAFL